jgi:hypothetical protein
LAAGLVILYITAKKAQRDPLGEGGCAAFLRSAEQISMGEFIILDQRIEMLDQGGLQPGHGPLRVGWH